MTTVIRATTEHLDLVVPLFCDYRAFYRLGREEEAARTFIGARLRQRDSAILLALDEKGGARGFAQLYPMFSSLRMAPAWIFNDLFVRPDARRLGVAQQLLEAANQLARNSGATQLELSTGNDNAAAQRLYESRGWKRDREFVHYSLDLR